MSSGRRARALPVRWRRPLEGERRSRYGGGPQFMNCSLPTMPILVTPRRWALAMIIATTL